MTAESFYFICQQSIMTNTKIIRNEQFVLAMGEDVEGEEEEQKLKKKKAKKKKIIKKEKKEMTNKFEECKRQREEIKNLKKEKR